MWNHLNVANVAKSQTTWWRLFPTRKIYMRKSIRFRCVLWKIKKFLHENFPFPLLFCTFALAICPSRLWWHWGVRSRRVGHYILKGVTDALLLAVRNLGTFEWWSEQMQMWLHGVCILGSVVCCEAHVASMHTLRCFNILQCGCLLCLFITIGFLRPRTANRQKLSIHVFSFVVSQMLFSSVWMLANNLF